MVPEFIQKRVTFKCQHFILICNTLVTHYLKTTAINLPDSGVALVLQSSHTVPPSLQVALYKNY